MKKADKTKKVIGTLIASSILLVGVGTVNASPFSATELPSGYMQLAEGSCGEGKCGGDKSKAKEGSSSEGKCGGDKSKSKSTEGSSGGEGSGGGSKSKTKEGSCGEGKCGGAA